MHTHHRIVLLSAMSSLVTFDAARAESFLIDNTVTSQNAGYVLDGGDILTIDASGHLDFTSGSNIGAIQTSNGSNTIRLYGNVTATDTATAGAGVDAVKHIGSNNTTYVYGSIITKGTSGSQGLNGIVNFGDSNTTLIYGTVSTEGENSNGVWHGDAGGSTSDGNITLVAGRILTDGKHANGVFSNGVNNIITVDGAINVSGEGASGVVLNGDFNEVGISGSISSSGQYSQTQPLSASAITVAGNNNNITISGTLSALDVNSYALSNLIGISNSYTLAEGSRIIGDIHLENSGGITGNTLIFDVGSAMSYVFSTSGDWEIMDLDERPVVVGSAMAAGIGNAETADELMFDRSFNLNGSVAKIVMYSEQGERGALIDTYGMSTSRNKNGTISPYELDSRGVTVGLPIESANLSVIPFVNYHGSALDIADGTHSIDTQSLRFGVVVPQLWHVEDYSVGLFALAGRNSFDGTREVLVNQNTLTGITTIDAKWDSYEIEVGVDATSSYALSDRLTFGSNLGLAAHMEYIGSYSEQNYFAWDDRTIVQAYAKIELTLGYQASENTNFYGTASAWHRDVRSGESADYRVNSTAVNYFGGEYTETIASLRLGFGHNLGNGTKLNAEAVINNNGNAGANWGANIGLAARF